MDWTVALARRRFADVLRSVVAEPQAIYNRSQKVAVMIDPHEYDEFRAWKEGTQRISLGEVFVAICDACEEHEGLEIPPRGSSRRINAFLQSLEDAGE